MLGYGHVPHTRPHPNVQSLFSKVSVSSQSGASVVFSWAGPLASGPLLLHPQLLVSLLPLVSIHLSPLQSPEFCCCHLSSVARLCFRRKNPVTMTPPKVIMWRKVKVFTSPSQSRGHCLHLGLALSDVTWPPLLIQHRRYWFRGSWGALGMAGPHSKPPHCSSAAVLSLLRSPILRPQYSEEHPSVLRMLS